MADYNSVHSGQDIDNAISKVKNSSANWDGAVTTASNALSAAQSAASAASEAQSTAEDAGTAAANAASAASEAQSAANSAASTASSAQQSAENASTVANAAQSAAQSASSAASSASSAASSAQQTAAAALPKTGGTMSGQINMGGQKITGLGEPINETDAARLIDIKNLIPTFPKIAFGLCTDSDNPINYAYAGFTKAPTVIATTLNNGSNAKQFLQIDSVSATQAKITVYRATTFIVVSGPFYWIAIGN